MKRFTIAAICGSLLFVAALQVLSLQAQNPFQSAANDPVLSNTEAAPGAVEPQPFAQPQPNFERNVTSQPVTGQQVQQQEPPAALKKYPIWLLIKPNGVQFLQTQEEIATTFHNIPENAFLLGCKTAKFEAAAAEQKPHFQLACEDFLLTGRYGSQQYLDVNGASLNFSTKTHQLQFQGSEELPLELHSIDVASETRMQADEITLQLDSSAKTVTEYHQRTVVDSNSGLQSTVNVPVTRQISQGSSFQLSAQNITSLETSANPERTPGRPVDAGANAPRWDPDSPSRSSNNNNGHFFRDSSPETVKRALKRQGVNKLPTY